MICPVCRRAPTAAAYAPACSEQCEARLARAPRADRLERRRCDCGGELHTRLERGLVVIRCHRCRSVEQLSPLVIQHMTAA